MILNMFVLNEREHVIVSFTFSCGSYQTNKPIVAVFCLSKGAGKHQHMTSCEKEHMADRSEYLTCTYKLYLLHRFPPTSPP